MDTSELSILSNASTDDLVLEPYPHLVINNALRQEVFDELQATLPPPEIVLDGRPKKDTWFDYPACEVVKNESITELWREFFRYHTSDTFFKQLVGLYGDQLRALHPDIETKMGKKLEQAIVAMRPGGRYDRLAEGADVSMECQFYVNYTEQPRAVRGSHVDRPSELFAALLYFRQPGDESTGGDLEVNRAINPEQVYKKNNCIYIDELPMEVSESKLENVAVGKYEANTLVLFLNSRKSIHAVSPRSATPIPRRHINFCCDLNFDLFELDMPKKLALKTKLEKMPVIWRAANWL